MGRHGPNSTGLIKLLSAFAAAFAAMMAIVAVSHDSWLAPPLAPQRSLGGSLVPTPLGDCLLNLGQYSTLSAGDSYGQVLSKLGGCPGTVFERDQVGGSDTVIYRWPPTESSWRLQVTFRNNALISKSQRGLK